MEEKLDVLNEFGEFTNKIATREECHKKGLWHRAVYGFIIDKNSNVLLQKRSSNKKLWPNKWDVIVGGHVEAGEFGMQTIIRECKEELGLDVKKNEIRYLVSSTSVYIKEGYANKHYDECYLIMKDVDMSELKLQKEEVIDAKYFSKKELLERIDNNYNELTEKTVSWHFLKKILDSNLSFFI